MKWLHYILIRLTLFFLLGIVLGFNYEMPIVPVVTLLGLSFLGLIGQYYRNKKRFSSTVVFSIISYFTFLLLGVVTVYLHQDKNKANHYLHYIKSDNVTSVLQITSVLKPDKYTHKYIAAVSQIANKPVTGKTLVLVSDSLKPLQLGDQLVVRSVFKTIASPKNPYGFNYNAFMKHQQVYKQLYCNDYIVLGQEASIQKWALDWRKKVINRLKNKGFKPQSFAVFKGLLLGDKQGIDKSLRQDYGRAGVMHILAISGLHIGILLWLLNIVFKGMEQVKYGVIIKSVLILSILWFYALLTGLSPSVVRAVTMFSFVTIGIHLKRGTYIFNTLFAALFILLLFNPFYIYNIGFQLSFVAVFGIVLFQPILARLLVIEHRVLRYIWQLLTVSLAAQISVLPLSLYYFHQFPGLFLLSNLVIIPALTFIISVGILILILASLNIVIEPLIQAYNFLFVQMNAYTHWVAVKEAFVFQNIAFDTVQMVLSFFILMLLLRLLYKKQNKHLIYLLMSIAVFQAYDFYKKYNFEITNKALLFHKSRTTLLARTTGRNLQLYTDSIAFQNLQFIINFKREQGINKMVSRPLKNWHLIADKKLLIVDNLGVYKTATKATYILLRNSPKINLNRLITWHHPKMILADGSNYKNVVKHWKKTCEEANILFWNTREQGAFTFEE